MGAAAGSKRKKSSSKVSGTKHNGIGEKQLQRQRWALVCDAARIMSQCCFSTYHANISFKLVYATPPSPTPFLMLQVARKRPAVPASTSASAAAAGTGASGEASRAPPSSAGHTPMVRFGCGMKATPPQPPRFPSLTPPSKGRGTLSEAPTPDLSGFKSGRPSSAGPGFTPGSEAGTTPGARGGGSVTPQTPLTPDSAAKAALQGKLDLTPAAGAGKPGVH
jgi:hypothetical protein